MTVKWPSKTYHPKVNGSAWRCCGDSLDKELFSILSLFTHMYKMGTFKQLGEPTKFGDNSGMNCSRNTR